MTSESGFTELATSRGAVSLFLGVGLDGRIRFGSSGLLESLGHEAGDYLGKPFTSLLESGYRNEACHLLQGALVRQGPVHKRLVLLSALGLPTAVEARASVLLSARGKTDGALIEMIPAEDFGSPEELEDRTRPLLTRLFARQGDPALLISRDHEVLAVNAAFLTSMGYERAEVVGRHTSFLESPDGSGCLGTEAPARHRLCRLRCADGREAAFRGGLLSGGDAGWMWVLRCATSPLRSAVLSGPRAEGIERALERLDDALSAAADGLWEWSPATGELRVTPRFREILGLSRPPRGLDEVIKRVHPQEREALDFLTEGGLPDGASFEHEIRMERQRGRWRWFRFAGFVRGSTPESRVLYGSLGDVHERVSATLQARQRARELDLRNRELQQRNQELDEFSSVVSHDLKEPLRAIQGFARLLEEDLDAGDQDGVRHDLGRIMEAGERMQSMIGGLLELGRMGAQANEPRLVPIAEVIHQALEVLEKRVEESGARITREIAPSALCWVDPDLCLHLVTNLLSNALKHTCEGQAPRVEITVRRLSLQTHLLIRDHGPGIPVSQSERIFQPFLRLQRGQEGYGVGLAICRKVVRASGGRIWVEQPPDGGSRFCVALPSSEQDLLVSEGAERESEA